MPECSPPCCCPQVLSCDVDLLHPPQELEKRKHKLKRLVASPNSYFMDVKCQGCFTMYAGRRGARALGGRRPSDGGMIAA